MTHPTDAPCRIELPMRTATGDDRLILVLHQGRPHGPAGGLRALREFTADGHGGWIAAARAASGGWGYLDGQGRWRSPPTWADARSFGANPLARCRVGERWGYAERSGALALAARFEEARPFHHGLAAVRGPAAGGWGFIDALGRPAFAQRFFSAGDFGAHGLAPASPLEQPHRCGYIDRSGAWAIAPHLRSRMGFGDQAVVPATADGQHWGLMDSRGRWVMPPRYPLINAFNADGLAYFAKDDSWTNGHGYLDAEGQVVLEGDRALSAEMACGLAAAEFDGSRYRSRRGLLATPPLRWGRRFSPLGHAVVRLAGDDATPDRWALLQQDGQVLAPPALALEPVPGAHGRLPVADADAPLTAFLGRDGSVLLLDGSARLQWQARFEGQRVQLLDAAGREGWRGDPTEGLGAPAPFFAQPPEAWLGSGLARCDDIPRLARALLADAEARLHDFAAGRPLAIDAGAAEDVADDGDEDLDEDLDEDGHDPAADPIARAERQAARLVTRRRVLRVYVGEDANAHYPFLISLHSASLQQARARLVEGLGQAFGTPDPDPEHMPLPSRALDATVAWAVPLGEPMAHDVSGLREARELWLCLCDNVDAGDGDEWHEVWLLAAPSLDALAQARRQRLSPPAPADAAHASPFDRPLPPCGPAPIEVPRPQPAEPDWGAAELEAQVRAGCDSACRIPPERMTAEALALCRQLYGRDPAWCWHDDGHSQLPAHWDHNSLSDLWGGLLDEALCVHAVQAGAPLRDVPAWLRSPRVEQAALATDIYNIGQIAPQHITPALAERAVRHDYGQLIAHLPEALLTPALCLSSARANGLSLACMPEAWRSTEVCIAALRDDARAWPAVPAALRVAVCSALIAQDRARAPADEGAAPGRPAEGAEDAGTRWHGLRAWARLWQGDFAGAIADARLALPAVRYPQHAHYVLARALAGLGQHDEAVLAASSVLALEEPYQAEFNADEDTGWLRTCVQARARTDAAQVAADSPDDEARRIAQLRRHPLALADMPREAITEAMVDAALGADPEAIRFVPRRLMTSARYRVALEQRVKHIGQVPPALIDNAIRAWLRDNA